jgi:8-oxo-dGTP pyrophosphatase MutT (NUDIX family)
MAPPARRLQPEPGITPHQAAILVPLHTNEGEVSLLLTLRQENLRHHGGEISFPGGAMEPTEQSFTETALREAREEIHLSPEAVQVLGNLTPLYIPPSHNLVHPVVGRLTQHASWSINTAEVQEILSVPLRRLLAPETARRKIQIRRGETRVIPCYQVGEYCIWGATAMVLSELLFLIQRLAGEIHSCSLS